MASPLIYISGALPNSTQEIQVRETRARLLSCHGSYLGVARRFFRVAAGIPEWKQRPVMLDSGAFSAWKTGKPVTLDEVTRNYEEMLNHAKGKVKEVWLINLDVIPGQAGRDPTGQEIADAIRESDTNFGILERRFGRTVLPVFHQGEDTGRLREVVSQSIYIGVSPRNDVAEPIRVAWSQSIHQIMRADYPGIRTHGLAATGFGQFTKVPWYSVDSASWIIGGGAYGAVFVWLNNRMQTIGMTIDSPRRGEWDAHIDNMSKPDADAVWEILDASPFTREELRNDGIKRATVSLGQFYRMQDGAQRKDTVLPGSLF